ncbi:MAG: prephenate dehydratase [Opitutales bacterium]
MSDNEKRLKKLRDGIDGIDRDVVRLLNERVRLAREIGSLKRENGTDYYDPSREAQVMDKIKSLNEGPLNSDALSTIYREVIAASIALEKKLRIAYLGPEATYTHQAAIRNFGATLDYEPMKTIPDVFAEVEHGDADYGVIPIENSTEGAVFHSMDMLVESDLRICAQVYLPIEHCLIARSSIEAIREVHSRDQALGQCRDWLRRHLPDAALVEVSSTSGAVRTASERSEVAAVAAELAGELHGLKVIRRGIQDRPDNVTRFLVVGKTQAKPLGEGRDKTSLVLSLKDKSGALAEALRPFASRGINLTKIESRPSRKKAWDYFFFVDLIGHYEDEPVREALVELEERCSFVKWLGSYPHEPR